jgi:hypothetical protein
MPLGRTGLPPGAVAVVLAVAFAGCAHWRGSSHPAHVDFSELGAAFVGRAVPPGPLMVARLMAIRVSDDDGRREARIAPAEIARWVAFSNQAFRPAGIRLQFDSRDVEPLRSNLINRLEDTEQDDWPQAKRAADEVAARHPDRLVVLFRYGAGAGATSGGLSGTDYNFVVMPGWPDDRHCGHEHISALAHEIGHHLGLDHTFARVFPEPVFAERFLLEQDRDPSAFDGDALRDTLPDPAIRTTECRAVAEVVLGGVRVPLARRNIMSYYDERDSLTPQQIRRLRWFLHERLAHRLKLPRNEPSAHRAATIIEGEELKLVSSRNGSCVVQEMDEFGIGNWSAGGQLFCQSPEGQMSVRVQLPVASSGLRRLDLYATRAPDYGVIEVALDGQPLGAPYDAWAPAVLATGAITLGERRLEAGQHELSFLLRRKNPESTAFHLGIDAIALVRVEPQS